MFTINISYRTQIIALFIITIISYGFYNAYLPITDPVESNYVLSAITMLNHNSWISPMIYDHVWYDKPPLTYWALMICYKLFGISDFVSRIPNTLIAGASVSLMYHIVYRIKQSIPIAVTSAILLMSTLQFWYISHAIVTDGFLFFFNLAIFGYTYLAFTNKDKTSMVKAYVAAALAVLTKGPIGLLLPGLILLLYIVLRKILQPKDIESTIVKNLKIAFNPLGILLFFIIASPWYLAMYAIHGQDFINGFLGLQNVGRALISEHPKFDVWYYYLVITPLALLPWTPVIIYHLRKLKWKDPLNLLGAIWFVTILLFYSIVATKYLTYTLPAIIPCIIWGGDTIVSLLSQSKLSKHFNYLVLLPLGIYTCILGIGVALSASDYILDYIIIISLGALLFKISKHYIKTAPQLSALLLIPILALYTSVTISVAPILTSQSGIQFKSYLEDTNQPVFVYGGYYTSLVYYTDHIPTQVYLNKDDDERWAKARNIMPTITKDEFLDQLQKKSNAIVIVPNRNIKDFEDSAAAIITKPLGKTNGATVYKVQDAISF